MLKKLLILLFLINIDLYADKIIAVFYNDFFANQDRHFTNGTALCWLDEKDSNSSKFDYTTFILDISKALNIDFEHSKHYNAGISLSQMVITPIDTSITTPQYDDIPYAGYLALSSYLFQWDSSSFYEYRIEIGVVGKESFAGVMQKSFHSIIDNKEPQGWDTQVKTSYIINTLFRYGNISWVHHGNINADWLNNVGVNLGKFSTSLFGGTIFRFGQNYTQNFNIHYPYLKEEASMIVLDKKNIGFGWALNFGLNFESYGYSYILDEAKEEGYEIDKRVLDASAYFGIDLSYNNHKLTFFYRSQTPYIKEQNGIDIYGGLLYEYQF